MPMWPFRKLFGSDTSAASGAAGAASVGAPETTTPASDVVDLQGSLVSKQPLTFHPRRAHIGHGGHPAITLLASFRITHAHSVVKITIQATYCMHTGTNPLSRAAYLPRELRSIEGLLD
ncbi:hypothetical protein T492DRAFT_868293 [Pavlovales sp. CCMP2436]|nr:hypothetical protein T492DRAFT_868293 [Pavlovales sp. CCMP2436]